MNKYEQFNLSDREIETIKFAIQGLTVKDMGKKMFITEKGVKYHLTNIYRKTNCKNKIGLVIMFSERIEPVEFKEPLVVSNVTHVYGQPETEGILLPVGFGHNIRHNTYKD